LIQKCNRHLIQIHISYIHINNIESIYMTTSLYIDKETKQKATQKAKKDQLSFSAVVRILLSDYASGKIVIGSHMANSYEVSTIPVDKEIQSKMDSIVTKWHNKK